MIFNVDEPLVDLHCHILPGVDDGPASDAAALEMLQIAAVDGIAQIVATPHMHHTSVDQIVDGVERLNRLAREADIPVEILPGSEVRIAPDLIERWQADELVTLNQTSYLLLELHLHFNWQIETIELAVGRLHDAGLQPVLAHVERYAFVQRDPSVIAPVAQLGVPIQINTTSLTGYHGPEAERTAVELLDLGLAHVLASDAHDTNRRAPKLRDVYRQVAQLTSPATATAMANRAQQIITGEPVNLADDPDEAGR